MRFAKLFFIVIAITSKLFGNLYANQIDFAWEMSACEAECEQPMQYPRIYLNHVEGRWLDNHQGYTSLDLFIPLSMKTTHCFPFLDLRGHVFNNGKIAANLGSGLRVVDNDYFNIYGINAFYDYRKAFGNHYFHELGIGLEVLNPCFDFRLNGYFPLGKRTGHSKIHFFDFGDGFKATCRGKRREQAGFDVEVGSWLIKDCCNYFDFYGALGFYSYFPNRHRDNIYGGEIRFASNLSRFVSVELRGGYDRINHTLVQGRVIFAFPYEAIFCQEYNNCCGLCDRLCQPIQRQEILSLSEKKCCWTWNWNSPCTDCTKRR